MKLKIMPLIIKDLYRGGEDSSPILNWGQAVPTPPRVWKKASQFLAIAFSVGLALLFLIPGILQTHAELLPADALGLRLPPGFKATLYADSDLANDIYAMTLDSHGRVVVTGPGYIKTLLDRNQKGRAEDTLLYATTKTGGMGLCFDADDLYFAGDGAVSLFHDRNGDGIADGPPDKLISINNPEHGGHALRIGPEGSLYFIGGNDSGFSSNHVTVANSPIRVPEAGCLLRLSRDGKKREIIAEGFRNPYDFDFNASGDIFTYDSDVEKDYLLPWYSPTRLFHVAYGGHHGWRLNGWTRSWNRPNYYEDAVDTLGLIGRGSPTGIAYYRHYQFPEHYRNGFFALDWTFGKVYFCPAFQLGATYGCVPEMFLEPAGTQGFAPTDAAVGPDGSLYISIGGRKTRGAVYKIEYVGDRKKNFDKELGKTDLDNVLNAPQPLDAWSRAHWVPLAQRLGPAPFLSVLIDKKRAVAQVVRAIEVYTELFGALPDPVAEAVPKFLSPPIRARFAWALGRHGSPKSANVLLGLARDENAAVRRAALESLCEQRSEVKPLELAAAIGENLSDDDKRVRQLAAKIATELSERAWQSLWSKRIGFRPQIQIEAAFAALQRNKTNWPEALEIGLGILRSKAGITLQVEAARLVILSLGDWNLRAPSVEVYTAYELADTAWREPRVRERLLNSLRPAFPAEDSILNAELGRLLAMLEDEDPQTAAKVAALFTDDISATSTFHFLTILSRLKGRWTEEMPEIVAEALLNLDRKLEGAGQSPKQAWNSRLSEVVTNLMNADSRLSKEILKHPRFVASGHIILTESMPEEDRLQAARLYLSTINADTSFPWSPPLANLLTVLPPTETAPLFRQQWENAGLRDLLIVPLARSPEEADHAIYFQQLNSSQPAVVSVCVDALKRLPARLDSTNLIFLFRSLQNNLTQPPVSNLRGKLIDLVNYETGQSFQVTESPNAPVKKLYQPVFDWFGKEFPALANELLGTDEEEAGKWKEIIAKTNWKNGNPPAGKELFRSHACESCHAGGNPIGPDLTGVTSRFSVEDLFQAIIFPNREVAPSYRTTTFKMKDGQIYTGIVAFESADGVIVQTGAAATVRLAENEIVSATSSSQSLMPSGLLTGLQPQDMANLYAYLQTLGTKSP